MTFLLHTVLTGCAVILGIWMKMPWAAVAGLTLLAAETASAARKQRVSQWGLAIVWSCTLIVAGSLLLKSSEFHILDSYCVALAWLNATAFLLASRRTGDIPAKRGWKLLAMTWAFFGGFIWLALPYTENLPGAFRAGLLVNTALLILCKLWFRLPTFAIQFANTLILLLLGLPIVDLVSRPHYEVNAHPDPAKQHYLYENAKKDPAGFASWQAGWARQWGGLEWKILVPDPAGIVPWHLRPNSQGVMFESRISINSKGFRGKEIPEEKGSTYRIVALGESTTFGLTYNAEDKPWPELLEQIIKDRLKPQRPVEVINAGMLGYNLTQNLYRLPKDILPLKPDMIISYHGYNGFPLIERALPLSSVKNPPTYTKRPLKLLADCEYRLKIIYFKQRQIAKLVLHPPTFSNPMETEYAQAYRQLIQIAHTNRVRLVLANYSMAVNGQSDPDVVEFYRAMFPVVLWQMKANVIHSEIVKQLAQQHPEVCFVDTHPDLDGEHGKFTDLMHFTHDGDQQLAETFFAGVREVLEEELSRPDRVSAAQ